MRHKAVLLVAVPAILFAAEIRLSRSDPQRSEPEPLPLWETALSRGTPARAANCPILVSIDPKSKYTLTSVEEGVLFDIDADGDVEPVAWTQPGTDVAFLALDADGDGRITSGRELIGDRTLAGVATGLIALSRLAGGAGTVASLDMDIPLFAKLRLWRDANHNGRSETGELRPVPEELSTIGLGYHPHRRTDGHGNQSRYRGFVHVRTAPGKNAALNPLDDRARRRYVYDVCLATG